MRYLLLVLPLTLLSCEVKPPVIKAETPARFSVERQTTFTDLYSPDGQRSVYILTDSTTGRKWVGVTGLGMSELHQ